MRKANSKILNITIIAVIILNLFYYQMVLPTRLSYADEITGAETEEAVDSGSSGSDTSEDKADDSEEASDESADNAESADDSNNASESENADATTPATDTSGNTTDDTANNTPLAEETPATVANPTDATSLETPAEDMTPECVCEDVENDEYTEEQKPDCEKPTPDNCQCWVDYCDGINNSNVTENSENTAEADSTTGGNEIVGNPQPEDAATTETGAGTGETANTDTTPGTNSDQPNNTETSSSTDISNPENTQTSAVIDSGDAAAGTAAVNEVNTNIYTENGVEIIQNIVGDYVGDINLLTIFYDLLVKAQESNNDEDDEDSKNTNITNINIAKDVVNKAIAKASSGNNSIEGADGDAGISTGDAQAIASAINLINTNIVGNNWLFAIINVLGNWTGDLIVPGEGLLKTPVANMIFDKILNVNQAENVENSIGAEASTGNNSISDAENANIQTGDALASASGVNMINTNITNNNWFFLLINNAGSWTGRVINWNNGVQYTAFEYNFGSLDNTCQSNEYVSVYNYNSAENIKNTVMASADTGNNKISSSGNAAIYTGNAGAWASAMNFVNTNITGNNWMFGIVNNAGNWNGNIVFGYPDLAVSLTPDKDRIEPGEKITYTLRYKNLGQARCDNVNLSLALPQYLSYLSDTNGSGSGNGENRHWSLSGLKPGEERSFQLTAKLAEETPDDIATLESSAEVSTGTAEKELSNNSSSSEISTVFTQITIENGVEATKSGSALKISRKDNATVIIGSIDDHTITASNKGKNTLYNILVTEKISDPSGQKIGEYSWVIAKLKKGQQAVIQYQLSMAAPAQLGTYAYSASALGYNKTGYAVKSGKAKANVNLVAGSGSGEATNFITEDLQQLIPPAEAADEAFSEAVLGANDVKNNLPWAWLLVLAVIPAAYFTKRNELYRWEKIQRFAKQASGFFSSWF